MNPLIGCTSLSIDLSVMEYMRDWHSRATRPASPSNYPLNASPQLPTDASQEAQVPENLEAATYSVLWKSNSVLFKCAEGHKPISEANASLIREWTFSGNHVPQGGDEHVRLDLWISADHAPRDSNNTCIVITRFEFLPLALSAVAAEKEQKPRGCY